MAVAAELEHGTWTSGYFDVSSTAAKRYSSTVVNVDCVPHLFWWICHSEGLWKRSWADDLVTKAFVHISLCLNIDARPPDTV